MISLSPVNLSFGVFFSGQERIKAISEYERTESEGITDGKSVSGTFIRRTLPDFPSGTPLVPSFPEIT
jgi:hypothetical protein